MRDTTVHTLEYASSVDRTKPLVAEARLILDGRPKPLLLVMHGFGGDRHAVRLDIEEWAERGVVAVAPDMRGRGDSGGEWDAGGLDVHDIVDAVLASLANFPAEIDAGNLNIVGYCGGGGNAIAAACRFPDLFNTAVSFFGIADYGGWYYDNSRPDCVEVLTRVLGRPEAETLRYEARNCIPAAANPRKTRMCFLWDRSETMCPPHFVEKWIAGFRAVAGEARTHVTDTGDKHRWIHNYRQHHRDLSHADALFVGDVLERRDVTLPTRGELHVPGYLVTRHFSVFVGDGTEGSVRVRYRLFSPGAAVEVIDNPRGLPVRISQASVTSSLSYHYERGLP